MARPILKRTLWIALAVLAMAGGAATLARARLLAAALDSALVARGAEDVRFSIDHATPWRIVVVDLAFRLATGKFSAERITVARRHWWSPTLGLVRVENARVPVALDAGRVPKVPAPDPGPAPLLPDVPIEEVSCDGHLVVRAGDAPEQALAVRVSAKQSAERSWRAEADVTAPGLAMKVEADYAPAARLVAWRVPAVRAEVKPLLAFAAGLVPLPAGEWEVDGSASGQASGTWDGQNLAGTGRFELRAAAVTNAKVNLAVQDLQAALEFTDLAAWRTKPARLQAHAVRVGRIEFTDVAAVVALDGLDHVAVSEISARALGGALSAEPFVYSPSQPEVGAVVLADGLDAEQLLALTQDLPAKATGRVSGRLPMRYGPSGLRFGTGWLGLKPGVAAEVQFNAAGLLTTGVSPKSPTFAVLQKIETGLLRLKVNELRLEVRPPNAPEGRSAQLHVSGEPVDREVRAPVTLDLNVNGPIESLLNLGLKGGVSAGTKP